MEIRDGMIKDTYQEFLACWKEIAVLNSVAEHLAWDQEIYLPAKAVSVRGDQQQVLARLVHEQMASGKLWELVERLYDGVLAGSIEGLAKANVCAARRKVERARRVPAKLIEEMAALAPVSLESWREARQKSDFSIFRENLRKIIRLERELAEAIGYQNHPYEALLAGYEPGIGMEELDKIFTDLERELPGFVRMLAELPNQPNFPSTGEKYAISRQKVLSEIVLARMGFDFSRGRIDISTHPFTADSAPDDVRLTTRYRIENPMDGLYSAIHEGGHGLFAQGIDQKHLWTPVGGVESFGLHESQSRFWEVWIGRSSQFWEWLWPFFTALFSHEAEWRPKEFFRAVNRVERTAIRVDSDPVTYNLHILLRYKIEQKLIGGDLEVDDLPGYWNELMQKYIGITPASDAQGVLQDIHWAGGDFGYFPTYTLGNIASAAIFQRMEQDLEIKEIIRRGELVLIKDWLGQNIHRHGGTYLLKEALDRIGAPLSVDTFMSVLKKRMNEVYDPS